MSPYRSREAPVPGSSVSETYPGFWADHIRHEKVIHNRWYDNYGSFYYEKPCTEKEPAFGPINEYMPPLKERRYLHNGRVSPSQPMAYLKACMEEKKVRDAAAAQVSSARAHISCKSPLQLSHISDGYALYDRPERPPYCSCPRHGTCKPYCICKRVLPTLNSTEKPYGICDGLPVATKIDRKARQQYIDVSSIPLNKNAQLAKFYTDKSSETCVSSFSSKTWDERSCLRKDEPAHKEAETGGQFCKECLNDSLLQEHNSSLIICGPREKGFEAPNSLQTLSSCTLHGGMKSSAVTHKGEPSASIGKCTCHAMVDGRSCHKPKKLGVADVLTWCATQEEEPSASIGKCTCHAMVDGRSCRKPKKLGVADVLTWCAAQEGKRGT